jgi:large subunit ribosomal protein L6
MSRIAKNPIPIPEGVEVTLGADQISVKGTRGLLTTSRSSLVNVRVEEGWVHVEDDRTDRERNSMGGTLRANLANMIQGVSKGYERKLVLVGVGYRAQTKGNILSLSLGFSHPLDFEPPTGITIETPSQTEILVKGCDKQAVGQVAANIRAYRPPEPYKGKGVKYSDEEIIRKEAKKK